MGRSYSFDCPQCRYQAVITGGGDGGLHCVVKTVCCRECRALYDVPVRLRVAEPEVELAQRLRQGRFLNRPVRLEHPVPGWDRRLTFGGRPRFRWVAVKLRCPVSAAHRIEPWHSPGKCPRCGHLLDRTLKPYRIWE